MKDHNQKEMTLRDLIRVIFRHKLVIIVCFITIMIAVYIGLDLRTPVYSSDVRMLVTGKMQKDLEVERSLGPGSLIATQMSLVLSSPIIERTVKALNLDQRPLDYEWRYASRLKRILIEHNTEKLRRDIESMTQLEKRGFLFKKAMNELAGQINTFALGETSIFVISVSDFNPAFAQRIANVLSRSYVIFDLEQQIAELQLTYGERNETIKKLENLIEELEETLDGRILTSIEAMGPASVKIISQAGPGRIVPLRPSKSGGLIAGFLMSIVLGVTLAFVFDFFDQTFRSPADVKRFLKIPCLGSVPKRKWRDKLLIKQSNPVTRYAQLSQNLSNRIYLSMKDQNLKSLLLTDAEGSEATAVITANLGICLSHKVGYRVLIIDANLRTPSLHKEFNIPAAPGLTDVVEGKINFENAVSDLGSHLTVLPAGDTVLNPIAILDSTAMRDVINKAKELYEIIFINCANIKNFSDAVILSSFTDSTALVINEGKLRRQIVKNAIAQFKFRNIKILGAVLNNHRYVIPEIIYRLT